ncbi:hypothetical protein NC652_038796 [Populus alba x Populus x berolinensis]|nr:hypothetical protein NC652_038796 [Populus alba x Populus x berolinensis]
MDITHSIKQFFLSIATLLNLVWGRVRCLLPSPSSNRSPSSPAFDLESPSLEALSQLPPQTPPATDQISQNPETQPPHFENHAPEMLRPPLQPLHPSHATPAPPAIDLESHSQESQAQTSATQETQPLQSTPINTEILSQTAQSQAPQPHSAMETEQQLAPPTQQTPPRAINPRLIHTVVVRRISVEWPNDSTALTSEEKEKCKIAIVRQPKGVNARVYPLRRTPCLHLDELKQQTQGIEGGDRVVMLDVINYTFVQ